MNTSKFLNLNIALLALIFCSIAVDARGVDKSARRGRIQAKMQHIFNEMDTNNDGKISSQESQIFHAQRFTAVDTNNDGFVTQEEGKAYHKAKFEQFRNKRAQANNDV